MGQRPRRQVFVQVRPGKDPSPRRVGLFFPPWLTLTICSLLLAPSTVFFLLQILRPSPPPRFAIYTIRPSLVCELDVPPLGIAVCP